MEMLDTRQLRAFHELGRRGSFTAAAQSLSLTQSAVSHSIKSLETTLGVSLFERRGKQVKLTRHGEILMPHVEQIFAGMSVALEELANFSRPGYGRLRIGSTVTLSQYVLPSVIRELRESFTDYEFSVVTDDTGDLLARLEDGEIDLALGLEIPQPTRFDFRILFEDEIAVAIAPAHPLASLAEKELSVADLGAQQLIFYSRTSETYRLVDQFFSAAKITLDAPMQMGSMTGIKEMAKIGLGVGLIAPWVAEHELRNETLVFRDLPDASLTRTWGIYVDPQRAGKLVEEVFAGLCCNVMKTLQVRTNALRVNSGEVNGMGTPARTMA